MRPEELIKQMRPVELIDQAVFDAYYTRFPQNICEYTFAQMLLWGESRQHLWTELDDHLIVCFQKREEGRKWYVPVGPDPARMIRDVMSPSEGFSYLYVPEEVANVFAPFPPGGRAGDGGIVRATPERFDYVYDLPALRSLEGKHYAEKRNFINRAKKSNPEVVLLQSSMADECQSLLERWMHSQPREGMNSLVDEISSLRIAMENFEKLKLFGVGIRINGQLEAFSFGVELNPSMFVEYFQKSTNVIPGLYPLVLHELCKALPGKYIEINLEEDLGIPGLKTAKERWNPKYQVRKWEILAKV